VMQVRYRMRVRTPINVMETLWVVVWSRGLVAKAMDNRDRLSDDRLAGCISKNEKNETRVSFSVAFCVADVVWPFLLIAQSCIYFFAK
jgi:hypothetical protein